MFPQTHTVPGLATVQVDVKAHDPIVTIKLDPDYDGDLRSYEQSNDLEEGVFLRCDAVSCLSDPTMKMFLEELHLWDHDGDGNYDGDHILELIDIVLWRTEDKPKRFMRPSRGWYVNTLMRFMPPEPDRHIVMGYGDLRKRFTAKHYMLAVPTIVAIVFLIQVQVHAIPWMKYSVITGALKVMEVVGFKGWLGIAALIAAYLLFSLIPRKPRPHHPISHSSHTYGFFNKAAVYEEQAFREGAENWTLGQRAVSCIVFGAIHMTNLIYPLATILPLAIGGAIFMSVYLKALRSTGSRRMAVVEAAVIHRVYNRLALIALGIWLIAVLGTLGAMLLGLGGIFYLINSRMEVAQTSVRIDRPDFSSRSL